MVTLVICNNQLLIHVYNTLDRQKPSIKTRDLLAPKGPVIALSKLKVIIKKKIDWASKWKFK